MKICLDKQQTNFKAHRPLMSIEKLPPAQKEMLQNYINTEKALPDSIAKKYNIIYSYQWYNSNKPTITIMASLINKRVPSKIKRTTIETQGLTIQKLMEAVAEVTQP